MAEFREVVGACGRGLAGAARFVVHKARQGYEFIDPDVRRHIAQVPLLGYSLIEPRQATVEAQPDDGHPPLVFVHGLGGSRGDFLMMALFLRAHGRQRSYRVHFASGQDVGRRAEELADFLRQVMAVNEVPQVDIVAHSLGGVIARLAIARAGLAPQVRTLITLGTPHGGTFPARFAVTDILLELRPGSPVVEELAAQGWPAGVRGATCWSRNDVLVLPAESAIVAGAEAIDLSPFTHYSYLVSPRSWATVARALERLAQSRPDGVS